MDPNQSNSQSAQKNKRLYLVVAIVAVVFLLIVGFILYNRVFKADNAAPQNTSNVPLPTEVTVELTENGFEPSEVTVKKGSAVRWVNTTGEDGTVNSADHPNHQKYRPLNLGVFAPDQTLVLIFNDVGEYEYHNHFSPENTGKVIVEE